jgi:hypothetical protein
MKRRVSHARVLLAGILICGSAWADGARLAVHPLELREMTPAQRERIQAMFDVMLARVDGVRLAGSSAIDEAMERPKARGCETRDDCLRFLAESTDSLYALYARLRPDPLGARLVLEARVVRVDGLVMRKARMSVPVTVGEQSEAARQLLSQLLEAMDLGGLSATLTAIPASAQLTPSGPVMIDMQMAAAVPVRRPVGFALLGVGAATLAAGGVAAGLAVTGRSALTPDSHNRVPPSQASRALDVAREGQAATVMIPVGLVIAAVGAGLAFWPADKPVAVTMAAHPGGAGLMLAGRLP